MKKWNEPEIDYLVKFWPTKTAKEIAAVLNLTPAAVSTMASKLKLKKSPAKKRELQRRNLLLGKYSFHQQYLDALANGEKGLVGYVTRPTMLGGQAERRFRFLIPEAIDANREIQINNPDFDFIYRDLKIDVKYASVSKRSDTNSEIWSIRTNGSRDLIVAFLERERGSELEEPYIMILPTGVTAPRKKIGVHKGGKWWKLVVEEEDLQAMLDEYAAVLKN